MRDKGKLNKESVVVRKGFFQFFRISARVGGSAAFEECRYVRKRNYRRTTPKADSCQYILAQTGVSRPVDLMVRHIPEVVAFMRVKVVAKKGHVVEIAAKMNNQSRGDAVSTGGERALSTSHLCHQC